MRPTSSRGSSGIASRNTVFSQAQGSKVNNIDGTVFSRAAKKNTFKSRPVTQQGLGGVKRTSQSTNVFLDKSPNVAKRLMNDKIISITKELARLNGEVKCFEEAKEEFTILSALLKEKKLKLNQHQTLWKAKSQALDKLKDDSNFDEALEKEMLMKKRSQKVNQEKSDLGFTEVIDLKTEIESLKTSMRTEEESLVKHFSGTQEQRAILNDSLRKVASYNRRMQDVKLERNELAQELASCSDPASKSSLKEIFERVNASLTVSREKLELSTKLLSITKLPVAKGNLVLKSEMKEQTKHMKNLKVQIDSEKLLLKNVKKEKEKLKEEICFSEKLKTSKTSKSSEEKFLVLRQKENEMKAYNGGFSAKFTEGQRQITNLKEIINHLLCQSSFEIAARKGKLLEKRKAEKKEKKELLTELQMLKQKRRAVQDVEPNLIKRENLLKTCLDKINEDRLLSQNVDAWKRKFHECETDLNTCHDSLALHERHLKTDKVQLRKKCLRVETLLKNSRNNDRLMDFEQILIEKNVVRQNLKLMVKKFEAQQEFSSMRSKCFTLLRSCENLKLV